MLKAFQEIYDAIYKEISKNGLKDLNNYRFDKNKNILGKGFNRLKIKIHNTTIEANGIILSDGSLKVATAFIPKV